MSRFSDSYVSRVLFATPAPGRSIDVAAHGGAGSGSLCSIHIGPNCTTCAALARNGERSTGAVPSSEGGKRSTVRFQSSNYEALYRPKRSSIPTDLDSQHANHSARSS